MISLKEKSKIFKDSGLSYYEKSVSSLELIDKDCSGAFWHKAALRNFIETNKFEEIKDSKLSGLTIGVKDLFCINGLDTTAGSKILEGFKSPYNSTVWERFKNKGVVLAGKTSMDEFAMGSFTNTSYLGKCSIPDRSDYSAGGSSGGSAAAVAGGFVDFSIGSDTGGSVRQPASFCGIVGFKPSYGGMSRFGMIAYASSLDQAGIMTKDLNDLDFILSERDLFLHDNGKDMTCVGLNESEINGLVKKAGYFKFMLDDEGISEDVKSAYLKLLNEMESNGIELIDVSIDYMKYVAEIYYIIACSEASSNLARYQGIFYGKKVIEDKMEGTYWDIVAKYRSKHFGEEAQRRIMLGSFILSAENYTAMYQKACGLRNVLTKKLNDVLETVDLIVLPTSPTVALKWDEINKMTSAQIYLADFMTVPFSLAGLPALSAPWFKNKDGLGIGMQLVGKRGNDFNLVRKALMLENTLGLSMAQVV